MVAPFSPSSTYLIAGVVLIIIISFILIVSGSKKWWVFTISSLLIILAAYLFLDIHTYNKTEIGRIENYRCKSHAQQRRLVVRSQKLNLNSRYR